jgi:aconitase B
MLSGNRSALARAVGLAATIAIGLTTPVAAQSIMVTTTTDIPGGTVTVTGATVSGTIAVVANTSDKVGAVGIQFRLGSTNLGAEITIQPYTLLWNTTTATDAAATC